MRETGQTTRATARMGLGTVQFGLAYGISNSFGKTPPDEVGRILEAASAAGVRMLDTASLYGDSEESLGRALRPGHPFRIVTKTRKFPGGFGAAEAASLEETFRRSLAALGAPAVHGLLVHEAQDLLGPGGDRLLNTLLSLKAKGLASRVGASIYTPAQADALLDLAAAGRGIDAIQVPCNVLDQRLVRGGQLAALKAAGVEIHVRSVFLQGLLLMDPESVQPWFDGLRPTLRAFREAAATRGLSPLQGALAFVAGRPEIDCFLVGVNDLAQFREILSALVSLPPDAGDWSAFHRDEERFVNPALWKTA